MELLFFWVAMQNPLVTLKGMKVKPEGKLLKNCFNVSLPLIGERIVVGCGDVVFSALVDGTWNTKCSSSFDCTYN